MSHWKPELEVNLRGVPTAGLMVYALRNAGDQLFTSFPRTVMAFGCESCSGFRLYGDAWEAVVWDLPVREWPVAAADFYHQVRSLLEWVVESGDFGLAWIAQDFVEPPHLFEPSSMSGSVYAAFSRETGLLHGPVVACGVLPLSDDQMVDLRSVSAVAPCFR